MLGPQAWRRSPPRQGERLRQPLETSRLRGIGSERAGPSPSPRTAYSSCTEPLVSAFFVDIVNSLAIQFFLPL